MCGIAGILEFDNFTPDRELLKRMGDIQAHRGPDDSGTYTAPGIGLSHRRLSIIDLSSSGHQPMCNEEGGIWLVFNGEIYNYLEEVPRLIRNGHRFSSTTDSEVVIHCYEDLGEGCLAKLNGMFAFAIWDEKKRSLFLARDRVGIKPLYYHVDGKRFVFASEIKAILCHPDITVMPNSDAIEQYLVQGHPYDDSTWYKGIRQLMPGHCLRVKEGRVDLRQYWDMRFNLDYRYSERGFVDELRDTVVDAVKIHLRSDVPVGAHLSGGIDSSSIVALASRELGAGIHTFSAAYEEGRAFDEREYIDIVSARFQTKHHVVVPNSDDVARLLERVIWHLDEPIVGPAVLPMFRVSELAAKNRIKVVNGGQGADELFAGYGPFVYAARGLFDEIRRGRALPPLSEVLRIPFYLHRGWTFAKLRQRLLPARQVNWIQNADRPREAIREFELAEHKKHSDLGPFEFYTYLTFKHYLRGLLQPEDRMSMAWSIESRVPLLDYRIVELCGRMPSWLKIKQGTTKWALREAMRGIVPDAVLQRRDKKGYPVPTSLWFAGVLRDYLRENLVRRKLLAEEFLRPDGLKEMIGRHGIDGCDYSGPLWLALTTELWFRGVDGGWKNVQTPQSSPNEEQ